MPFIDTFRCLWFNNTSADTFCLKTLKFIEKVYPQFVISCQQDSHECLIWLLNTLHEETKVSDKRTNDNKLDLKLRMYKSEEELASDALEQISGSHESTITDLFRGQFRSALKCANPMCGFTNLTFEPYLCVSLSVPLETKQCNFSVILISLIPSPVITRYYFAIPGSVIAVSYFKNLIMETLFEPSNDLIACSISPSGQIKLFSNDCIIDVANRHFNELNILEIPRISSGIQQDDVIVAIVVFTLGIFPYGERLEHPFTANLLKNWNYEFISNHLLDKGSHILPFSFCPLPQDYKILVQNSEYKVLVLDPQLIKPLNDYIICEKYNNKNVLRIVVEWDIKLRGVFMSSLVPAVVHNNYSFCGSENLDYVSKQSAISLTNLIDDYVKCESIRDWVCPKCKKSSGSMELQFHSLPDVLVFHLKRFESLSVGVTKKIDSRVQIPIEELDMSPYVFNQHLRSSTLPRNKRNGNVNKFNYIEKNSLIYYLTGVIYHYGERTNSGHYTAATRNPVDGKWRTFDDSRVSLIAESGYSFNELHNSSRSYLLFYQRRPYVKRQLTWFPQNVPEHIIQKYQRRFDCDDTDKSYTNGKSIFYKM
ncbi:Ubiquitin carboxyl-terminal hydrolase [Meloidogyne graminicola]|uniref:ubiquitinyl hydrolase 1 n=1 Tax=Meloidogyne graminicola TaxID=189291 RepID=A0A8T0A438_9BILA|nr:Ubiquitin carboxyl-terminal hydrolase [Meloidogyne graminicola]